MLVYLGLGVIWAWWLEYYTTKHLKGILGEDWKWMERIFHIVFWPATFSFFLYNLFRRK